MKIVSHFHLILNYNFMGNELLGNLHILSQTWKDFEFWCEGVLFSCLGVFGLISNLVTLITILSSSSMRQHTFNQLLAALSFIVIL